MKQEDALSLPEQVGEVKARTEDRVEQAVVPVLDGLFQFLSQKFTAAREHLTHPRKE